MESRAEHGSRLARVRELLFQPFELRHGGWQGQVVDGVLERLQELVEDFLPRALEELRHVLNAVTDAHRCFGVLLVSFLQAAQLNDQWGQVEGLDLLSHRFQEVVDQLLAL